jgi:hypothetical protein
VGCPRSGIKQIVVCAFQGLRYNLGAGIAVPPSLAEDDAAGKRRLLKELDLTAFSGRNTQ